MRTLRDSSAYRASSFQLGTPEEADDLLGDLEALIAYGARNCPIVQSPDVRLAVQEQGQIAVFFRIENINEIELLRILILEGCRKLAA